MSYLNFAMKEKRRSRKTQTQTDEVDYSFPYCSLYFPIVPYTSLLFPAALRDVHAPLPLPMEKGGN